jgi:hypothetical protein
MLLRFALILNSFRGVYFEHSNTDGRARARRDLVWPFLWPRSIPSMIHQVP